MGAWIDAAAALKNTDGEIRDGVWGDSTKPDGTDVATIDGKVDALKSDLDNATDGLGALKALIDTVDTKVDTIDTNVGTVDTVVDGIQTDISNATDGLGALKTLIDTLLDVSTLEAISNVSANGTWGTPPNALSNVTDNNVATKTGDGIVTTGNTVNIIVDLIGPVYISTLAYKYAGRRTTAGNADNTIKVSYDGTTYYTVHTGAIFPLSGTFDVTEEGTITVNRRIRYVKFEVDPTSTVYFHVYHLGITGR